MLPPSLSPLSFPHTPHVPGCLSFPGSPFSPHHVSAWTCLWMSSNSGKERMSSPWQWELLEGTPADIPALLSCLCFSGIPLSHITLNSNSVGSIFLNSNPYFSPQTWAQEVQIWEALVQGPGTSWKCALAPPVGKGGTRIHKYKSTTVRSFLHR